VLCTTVNALVQRVPPLKWLATQSFSAAPGNVVDTEVLVRWLEINGFLRSSTVRDTGEYAVRGGIIDMWPPGHPLPVRLDFFGDTLETIRAFDAESQRTTGQLRALDLVPMSEVQLTTDTMRTFRQAYIAAFGAATRGDTLYEAVSEGRRHPGMEHWMPLFYGATSTVFDYVGAAPLILDPLAEDAVGERLGEVKDYYDARKAQHDANPAESAYKPLPPSALYLSPDEWRANLEKAAVPHGPQLRTRARRREHQRLRGGRHAHSHPAG
jgi:transcription-repair coupling factor (superfamily II helicase)